ncbi:hypothetical protein ACQPVP_03535 [Clostridium nigeriense]|uniref:hypothetical protein n=1 Tax=Clostridium nigeriense TaxID=1805470 RepID=UPI003D352CAF
MLKLQPIEFVLRAIPESFLVIFAIYIFSKTEINRKKYLVTSIAFSIIIYITRMLPINYGVHMILSVLFLLFIIVSYNKIDVINGIKSIIFTYLVQLISEAINVFILNFINLDLETLFKDPVSKTILGIPSLVITGIIISTFYMINKKRKKYKKA